MNTKQKAITVGSILATTALAYCSYKAPGLNEIGRTLVQVFGTFAGIAGGGYLGQKMGQDITRVNGGRGFFGMIPSGTEIVSPVVGAILGGISGLSLTHMIAAQSEPQKICQIEKSFGQLPESNVVTTAKGEKIRYNFT